MRVKNKKTGKVHEVNELLVHWRDNEYIGKALCGLRVSDLRYERSPMPVNCKSCLWGIAYLSLAQTEAVGQIVRGEEWGYHTSRDG